MTTRAVGPAPAWRSAAAALWALAPVVHVSSMSRTGSPESFRATTYLSAGDGCDDVECALGVLADVAARVAVGEGEAGLAHPCSWQGVEQDVGVEAGELCDARHVAWGLCDEQVGRGKAIDERGDLLGRADDMCAWSIRVLACPGVLEQRLHQKDRASVLQREARLHAGPTGVRGLDDDGRQREAGHHGVAHREASSAGTQESDEGGGFGSRGHQTRLSIRTHVRH